MTSLSLTYCYIILGVGFVIQAAFALYTVVKCVKDTNFRKAIWEQECRAKKAENALALMEAALEEARAGSIGAHHLVGRFRIDRDEWKTEADAAYRLVDEIGIERDELRAERDTLLEDVKRADEEFDKLFEEEDDEIKELRVRAERAEAAIDVFRDAARRDSEKVAGLIAPYPYIQSSSPWFTTLTTGSGVVGSAGQAHIDPPTTA